jgi:hypothetical protein
VMKNEIETCHYLRHKLIMIGVTLIGSILVYGYNMYVIHTTHRPKSVFKKKSNSICYPVVCESAAMGESIIGNVPSVDNHDDICTKVVPGGQRLNHSIRLVLNDLCD